MRWDNLRPMCGDYAQATHRAQLFHLFNICPLPLAIQTFVAAGFYRKQP